MNKFIQLGIAKVSFTHHYEPQHFFNKKDLVTRIQKVPISTTVVIETGKELKNAKVVCSKKDHFTYEIGRKFALKKALGLVTSLTKEDRRRIWDEYNKLKPGGRW